MVRESAPSCVFATRDEHVLFERQSNDVAYRKALLTGDVDTNMNKGSVLKSNRNSQNIGGGIHSDIRTVLLVEDDDDVRELLAIVLRTKGYDVIELGDGMEALNYLAAACAFKESDAYPDIIISDIQMPMFTGLDLLVGMGECNPLPPLILFTGLDDPDLFVEAYRLGARRILRKPLAPEALCQAINDVLGNAEGERISRVVRDLEYGQPECRYSLE